ncbi:hypothetical protein [Salinigranum marinum]|uniref:hypothetical protein n=1 Tax=Salinigranum marinum TaxID=1515595 RepID=UPI002989FC51|nr:hypothetical protein [Salinigranum marinum]
MDRRQFVYLIGLLAGCNASTSIADTNNAQPTSATRSPPPSPAATPTRTPTTSSTPTATPQDTETPTEEPPEPTPEETETPTEFEVRGSQQLAEAERALTNVVDTFTDGYGSELTDVTASSTEFLNSTRDFQLVLARAQEEYIEASNAAGNRTQQTTADRMRGCWEFLRNTIRTQTEVITAYEYLISARDAFEQVEARAANDAIANFETARGRADSRYQDVLGSTAEEASVIPPISVSEHQQKVAQFEGDIGVYTDLDDALGEFAEGVKWLGYAKSEVDGENRNVKRAIEQATEAEKRLRSARRGLSDLIDSTGEDTTLVPTLNELRSVATAKIEEAEEIGA